MSRDTRSGILIPLNRTKQLAHALAFISVLLLAANFVVVRNIHDQYPLTILSLWRWGGSALLLLPFIWSDLRHDWPIVRRNWKFFVISGMLMPILGSLTSYLAMELTVAVNGGIIQSMIPAIVVLLAWAVGLERVKFLQIMGLGVATLGVLYIVTQGNVAVLRSLDVNLGDLFLVIGACSLAGYTVYYKRLAEKPRPLVLVAVICGIGALYHLPFVFYEFWQGTPMPFTMATTLSIVFVAIFPSLLTVMFLNYGIEKLGPGTATAYHYFMPVVTAGLAFLFLNEAIAWFHLIGTAMILAGVYLTVHRNQTRRA